jgi:ATP-dependent RNA helicase DeaD
MTPSTESTTSFTDLGLAAEVVTGATERGYRHPTAMQAQVIPAAMGGADLVLQTGHGAGKTAAYGMALLHRLCERKPFTGLVLAPTNEIVSRVTEELRTLAQPGGTRVCGTPRHLRTPVLIDRLKRGPTVVVGSPERVLDLHRRGLIPFDQVQVVVLDEADRMFDLGFTDSLRAILELLGAPHQTILIAESMTPEVERVVEQHMAHPARLAVAGDTPPPQRGSETRHRYYEVQPWDKTRLLVHLLTAQKPQSTLVFCHGAQSVEGLAEFLHRKGVEARPLQPDAPPPRLGRSDVLVASEAAARGIELGRLERVIHYDLPEDAAAYVHHLGRLAHSQRGGTVWSFVTPEQVDLVRAIEQHAHVTIERRIEEEFAPGPPPAPKGRIDVKAVRETEERPRPSPRKPEPVAPPVVGTDDPSRFPGGAVPVARPAKRMGGRVPTRRRS